MQGDKGETAASIAGIKGSNGQNGDHGLSGDKGFFGVKGSEGECIVTDEWLAWKEEFEQWLNEWNEYFRTGGLTPHRDYNEAADEVSLVIYLVIVC